MKLAKAGHDELELTYRLKTGERRSYSTQPIFILIVDKRYKNYAVKEVVRQ